MHASSDMLTEQEIERINNGEKNVVVTIDKDCSAGYRFRDGCDIMILTSPFSLCTIHIRNHYYTARPHNGRFEITEIFDDRGRLIAYKYRITTYKLYYHAHSNLARGTFVFPSFKLLHNYPVDLMFRCINDRLLPRHKLFRDRISRRLTIFTTFCK